MRKRSHANDRMHVRLDDRWNASAGAARRQMECKCGQTTDGMHVRSDERRNAFCNALIACYY